MITEEQGKSIASALFSLADAMEVKYSPDQPRDADGKFGSGGGGGDSLFEGRVAASRSKDTSSAKLHSLSDDDNDDIRNSVASHSNTQGETLRKLSKDRNDLVRTSVAKNEKTPRDTLKEMANDKNHFVRHAVAQNENTTRPTLKRLSKDIDPSVRLAAENSLDDLR
jgi:hypothetical protein